MTTTTPPPRFLRAGARGFTYELDEPLPPTLAELDGVGERVAQHRKVVKRRDDLRAELVELARRIEAADREHEEKARAAAMLGNERPRPNKSAQLLKQREHVEDELRTFEAAVVDSANAVLALAAPHFEQASTLAEQQQRDALTEASELLGALDTALARIGTLASERWWLNDARVRAQIAPYREHVSDGDLNALRGSLRLTFDEWLRKREERLAKAEEERRWEDEQREQWKRQAAQAAQQQAAERVLVSEGVIVEKGGKPVKRGAFGVEPVDEPEVES